MPIPTPQGKEKKSKFVSRCIEQLSKTDTSRPHDQIIAMCYSKWNARLERGKGKSVGSKRKIKRSKGKVTVSY